MTDPAAVYETIKEEVETVLIGNEHVIEQLSIALFTDGHVLLEGVPGVAKTTMAQSFARATGLDYSRVQMTPDILPADVTGTNIYRESTGEFEIQRGPVFANVVLADEINRATPKTQSALLEAMQEGQVTIEGNELPLPSPFMLIATQNPIEMDGTFELPEAQRDRFQLKVRVSIPNRDDEKELLGQFDDRPDASPADISAVVTTDEIEAVRETVADVHVSEPITDYILDTLDALRSSTDVVHGGSPRASLALMNASKARAAIHGRDYVIPDDIKALAQPVLAHRLVLSTDAELSDLTPNEVVERIVADVEPPSDKAAQAKQ